MKTGLKKLAIYGIVLLPCLNGTMAWAGKTYLVGYNTQGNSSVSANGRYMAFSSRDLYVNDRLTGDTIVASVSSRGESANNDSFNPSLSADGRYVSFTSQADNLVPNDTNFSDDVFVYDLLNKTTTRVSVASDRQPGNNISGVSSISADGRFVAFESEASNLVPGDTNGNNDRPMDIFVHDRLTRTTNRINLTPDGQESSGFCFNPTISADGRFVAFESYANDLVPDDNNDGLDVFVHDRLTKTTHRVSTAIDGQVTNGYSYSPSLSNDGRYVAFRSYASNLVAGDANNQSDIFVHDRITNTTSLVARSSEYFDVGNPTLSADGRYVTFNLYGGDVFTIPFVNDRLTNTTSPVEGGTSVASNGYHLSRLGISGDGRFISFAKSTSSDFNVDTFVRDRYLVNGNVDLSVSAVQQPTLLVVGDTGHYILNITNNGAISIGNVWLTYIVSNGNVTALLPSQGACQRRQGISFCKLKQLNPGESMTLSVDVKALRSGLNQDISVSSMTPAAVDPNQANNYLSLTTPVIRQVILTTNLPQ